MARKGAKTSSKDDLAEVYAPPGAALTPARANLTADRRARLLEALLVVLSSLGPGRMVAAGMRTACSFVAPGSGSLVRFIPDLAWLLSEGLLVFGVFRLTGRAAFGSRSLFLRWSLRGVGSLIVVDEVLSLAQRSGLELIWRLGFSWPVPVLGLLLAFFAAGLFPGLGRPGARRVAYGIAAVQVSPLLVPIYEWFFVVGTSFDSLVVREEPLSMILVSAILYFIAWASLLALLWKLRGALLEPQARFAA